MIWEEASRDSNDRPAGARGEASGTSDENRGAEGGPWYSSKKGKNAEKVGYRDPIWLVRAMPSKTDRRSL